MLCSTKIYAIFIVFLLKALFMRLQIIWHVRSEGKSYKSALNIVHERKQ